MDAERWRLATVVSRVWADRRLVLQLTTKIGLRKCNKIPLHFETLSFALHLPPVTNDIVSCSTLNSGFQHFITTNPTPTQNLQTLRRLGARCKWGQLPAPICAYRLFDFVLHIQLLIAIICNVKYVHATALNQTITSRVSSLPIICALLVLFEFLIKVSAHFSPNEQLLEDLRAKNLRFA